MPPPLFNAKRKRKCTQRYVAEESPDEAVVAATTGEEDVMIQYGEQYQSNPHLHIRSSSRKRRQRFSHTELETLVNEVGNRRRIICNRLSTMVTHAAKNRAWRIVTARVNAVAEVNRSEAEVRKKWQDWLSVIKGRHAELERMREKADPNKPYRAKTLTLLEEKVLDIVNSVAGLDMEPEAEEANDYNLENIYDDCEAIIKEASGGNIQSIKQEHIDDAYLKQIGTTKLIPPNNPHHKNGFAAAANHSVFPSNGKDDDDHDDDEEDEDDDEASMQAPPSVLHVATLDFGTGTGTAAPPGSQHASVHVPMSAPPAASVAVPYVTNPSPLYALPVNGAGVHPLLHALPTHPADMPPSSMHHHGSTTPTEIALTLAALLEIEKTRLDVDRERLTIEKRRLDEECRRGERENTMIGLLQTLVGQKGDCCKKQKTDTESASSASSNKDEPEDMSVDK